jgi:hypothetical protein
MLIGETKSFWLNDVSFEAATRGASFTVLNSGCKDILRLEGPDDHEFEILEEPWIKEVAWSAWLFL